MAKKVVVNSAWRVVRLQNKIQALQAECHSSSKTKKVTMSAFCRKFVLKKI